MKQTEKSNAFVVGLRTVVYKVTDLEKAKAWYSAAVGHGPYFDEPFYVGFEVGGYELALDPDTDGAAPGPGGETAYWGVANADQALAHLLSVGTSHHEPVREVGGGIRVASVQDPFGNVFGIIENPHFRSGEAK